MKPHNRLPQLPSSACRLHALLARSAACSACCWNLAYEGFMPTCRRAACPNPPPQALPARPQGTRGPWHVSAWPRHTPMGSPGAPGCAALGGRRCGQPAGRDPRAARLLPRRKWVWVWAAAGRWGPRTRALRRCVGWLVLPRVGAAVEEKAQMDRCKCLATVNRVRGRVRNKAQATACQVVQGQRHHIRGKRTWLGQRV